MATDDSLLKKVLVSNVLRLCSQMSPFELSNAVNSLAKMKVGLLDTEQTHVLAEAVRLALSSMNAASPMCVYGMSKLLT